MTGLVLYATDHTMIGATITISKLSGNIYIIDQSGEKLEVIEILQNDINIYFNCLNFSLLLEKIS